MTRSILVYYPDPAEARAYADLIAVDGDPLRDLTLLGGQGKHMPLIMKAGALVKNVIV